MDPKPSSLGMLLAPPPSGSSGALRLPPADEHPPIDQRLVRPETREQLVRGRRVVAMPANPAHGDRHFKLDYVIGAHVKEGYVGSTDLLTRSAETSDFATDTCIRRAGIDPRTDTRYLEELVFEVVTEQSMRDMTEREFRATRSAGKGRGGLIYGLRRMHRRRREDHLPGEDQRRRGVSIFAREPAIFFGRSNAWRRALGVCKRLGVYDQTQTHAKRQQVATRRHGRQEGKWKPATTPDPAP